MGEASRRDLVARGSLTIATLLPYWPLLTLRAIHVTDDGFASDIWNGDLPVRVLAGAAMRASGRVPDWTSQICSGAPLLAAEPLSRLSFGLLPPAAALDVLLLLWILVAAHGAFGLARRLGASLSGAWLAGHAFAVCGYLVAQLKHLGIVGTVVWLPLGLLLLDHALERGSVARRALCFALFGLVVGEQALSGFPQSLYICGLAYGVFALSRVLHTAAVPGESIANRLVAPLAWAALSVLTGLCMGAATLWPLAELGSVSDRASSNGFAWATEHNYWPRNVLTFLFPYANGDAADLSYAGVGLFWEDYGYVGALTFLLAVYALVRGYREPHVQLFGGLALAAFLLVLGPATPVFRLAFDYFPGLNLFRFPQRFLVVVDLCLCLLAALGLTRLSLDLQSHLEPLAERFAAGRLVQVLPIVVCLAVQLDLLANQVGQNAFVDGPTWLTPPQTVKALRADSDAPRVFTPYHMLFHEGAHAAAHGWQDTRPYFALRDLVQPNSNLYWGVASADCYVGIAPRWYIDAWGDHSRPSRLIYALMRLARGKQGFETRPAFVSLMRAYGVTHVLSPLTIAALEPALAFEGDRSAQAHVYRIPNSARARVVEHAEVANGTDDVVRRLSAPGFEPDALVVLSDAPAGLAKNAAAPAAPAEPAEDTAARIVRDDGDRVEVHVRAPRGGHLVLSDTWFPGWQAAIDGKPASIYRANLYVRAVPLPPGAARVVFEYRPSSHSAGRALTLSSAALLASIALGAALRLWRERRASRSIGP